MTRPLFSSLAFLSFWDICQKKSLTIISTLFRIMIPIMIIVKIMQEIGLIDQFAILFEPIMVLLGLPGAMAIVWCLTIFVNLFAGIIVLASLLPEYPLTIAQITILSTLMLVAHTLPIEIRITQAAGFRIIPMIILRLLSAIMMALLLKHLYQAGDFLNAPATLFWQDDTPINTDLKSWIFSSTTSLLFIALSVFIFVMLLEILENLGIIKFFGKLLQPILKPLNLGEASLPITMIGLTLGLSYGGGLIIQHVKEGKIPPRECFTALALMGVCHSLIEDSLLVIVNANAHYSGVVVVRIMFSLVIVYCIAKIINRMPEHIWLKYFWNSPEINQNKNIKA